MVEGRPIIMVVLGSMVALFVVRSFAGCSVTIPDKDLIKEATGIIDESGVGCMIIAVEVIPFVTVLVIKLASLRLPPS